MRLQIRVCLDAAKQRVSQRLAPPLGKNGFDIDQLEFPDRLDDVAQMRLVKSVRRLT